MIWLIGAGSMAKAYCTVLNDLNLNFMVIGRGKDSAASFERDTGVSVVTGGVENALESGLKAPEFAIIATGVEMLADSCLTLLKGGVKKILVEKPGGMNSKEIHFLVSSAKTASATIFVAYNRRFFSSVQKAKEIIAADGGVSSFNFEFTEWSHVIEKLTKADGVMEEWFTANSSHVVDLAFHLGGIPEQISCYTSGSLNWHKRSANFAGSGVARTGALFSYHANWQAPGRWGIEILTHKHRLYLRPMEQLQLQKLGSIALESVEIDNQLDTKYKPGLYLLVKAFLNGENNDLCSIEQQLNLMDTYNQIAGYVHE
ncbi:MULTISPECIES: Gfo/Idh/MocA family protein [Alkalimonas]|uniref:Gfo/Idh/MocA family oxidoreductase n=1 Tax=Alkalimonas mucilaginosa TaxID=3057676 RepID=A0ABU7JC22_9GAMM|nr:Gfo/Idh/MocA family oxidoreductase [Alkalimonas sp. MEB004]MEE2023030.1 Gfo/Idh/MocA family oxidoreductase [Alkalimonas sp. MEB004]